MLIDNILYQLLLQHECIIIPEFGGFIVRESPCNFNSGKDVLKPYGKSVFFNPHLNENDGLLINAIVTTNKVSYSEASAILEKWVESHNNNIAEIGKSNISKIGIFYKGHDNGKWFTVDSQLNLALSTYGLKPVKAGIVNLEAVITEVPKIEFKPLADNKPIESIELPRTNWKAWGAAAAIALVAHIGYLAFENKQQPAHQASIVPSISNNEPKVAAEVVPATVPEEIVIPENNASTVDETIVPAEEKIQETTVEEVTPEINKVTETIIPEKAAETLPETIPASKVIGKYKLEQNAIYHQKDLLKAGIDASIQRNEAGLFEVIVSEAASK